MGLKEHVVDMNPHDTMLYSSGYETGIRETLVIVDEWLARVLMEVLLEVPEIHPFRRPEIDRMIRQKFKAAILYGDTKAVDAYYRIRNAEKDS